MTKSGVGTDTMERNLSKLITAKALTPGDQRGLKVKKSEGKEGQTKVLKKTPDKTTKEHTEMPPLNKPFKTAIISSTNTTKSLSLAERPVRQKKTLPKVEKSETIKPRRRTAMSIRTRSQCSRESHSTGYESTDFAASVQRNLQQVTDLGTEFYEIIEAQLKTSIKNGKSLTNSESLVVDGASSGGELEERSMSVVVTKRFLPGTSSTSLLNRSDEVLLSNAREKNETKETGSSESAEVSVCPKVISPRVYAEHSIGETSKSFSDTNIEKGTNISESRKAEVLPEKLAENADDDMEKNRTEEEKSDQDRPTESIRHTVYQPSKVKMLPLSDTSIETEHVDKVSTLSGFELNISSTETRSPVMSTEVNSPSPFPEQNQYYSENISHAPKSRSALDTFPLQITPLATPGQKRNKGTDLGLSETIGHKNPAPSTTIQLPEENTTTLTIDEARKIMGIPLKVRFKDIMYVEGEPSVLQLKIKPPPINAKTYASKALASGSLARRHSFLSSWERTSNEATKTPKESIHHFCTVQPIVELPWHLKLASRFGHTPDRYLIMDTRMSKVRATPDEILTASQQDHAPASQPLSDLMSTKTCPVAPTSSRASFVENEEDQNEEGKDDVENEAELRMKGLAEKILSEVEEQETVAAESEVDKTKRLKKFMKLQEVVNNLFDGVGGDTLQVHGKILELKNDQARFFWTPAPPKLDIPPEVISDKLFPEYHGLEAMSNDLVVPFDDDGDQSAESETEEETAYIEWLKLKERTLNRRHHSLADMNDFMETKDQLPRLSPNPVDGHNVENRGETRAVVAKGNVATDSCYGEKTEPIENGDINVIGGHRRRAASMLNMLSSGSETVYQSDYDTAMREVEYHSEKLNQVRTELMRRQLVELETNAEQIKPSSAVKETTPDRFIEAPPRSIDSAATRISPGGDSVPDLGDGYNHHYSREISTYSEGTSQSVDVHGQRRSMSRRSTGFRAKPGFFPALKKCPRKVSNKRRNTKGPCAIERQKLIQEFIAQPARPISRTKSLESMHTTRALINDHLRKKLSLQDVLDTSHLLSGKGADYRWDDIEYVKEKYWYKWMDELYPPSSDGDDLVTHEMGDKAQEVSAIDDDIWEQNNEIEVSSDEENKDIHESLRHEIERMTKMIRSEESDGRLAFYICRRGACHRKLGELKKSKEDLDRAIEIEPQLLDAYWHRHLLFLAMDNTQKALADLDFIVRKTQTHARAFRSLCDIYKRKGDISGAITNITKAIKLEPAKVDLYYQRAELFEERGDTLLALDDYKTAHALMPSRTTAINRIGMYHFNTRMWSSAISDFSEQLKQEPKNAEVHLHRGISHLRLNQFLNALKDFSTAIQCKASSSQAFYYRGCILRKVYPSRALQDLSVSLMLDSTVSNVNAYMHRGILYAELRKWSQAMLDFTEALKLRRDLPEAHVNLGIIYLQVFDNPVMAVRRFSTAIRVDPTYVRAFVCRGEAYKATKNLKFATRDFTRAVHLHPNVMDYKIALGQLLLGQNNLSLAGRIIKQCAAMEKSYLTYPSQQAAVQTFLKNFKEAIDILQTAVKSKRDPTLLTQLGKTKMKAKYWREAKDDFERAIELMRDNFTKKLPKKAAAVYFLIGLCHMELFSPSNAIEAFNTATQLDNEYAEAYYQRGLAKMKLRNMKAILDFNKALAYNPDFFQAFISRAAFYGLKGRFAKAIMNCNEAISLQPGSVKAFLYRGSLKFHIKAFGLAVKDLTKAIQMSPACDLAYYNRAVCYHKMKHYQRALKDYSIVMMLGKKKNLRVLVNRGLLYLEIGDYANALQDFYASAEIDRKNPKVYHTLGICYRRLGRVKESLQAYTKAIEIDKFFVDGFIGRGNVLADLGTAEGHNLGRRDFVRALHINPKCMLARINLAYSLQIRGKFKAAWLQFTRAIDVDDGFRAAYEGRSVVNLQMSNFFAAFFDINSALKIEKTAELLTNRGVINQFMGDPVNAMRDYQEALKIDPSYPLAYYNAANVYFVNRQFSQAFEFYSKAIDWNQSDESALHNRAITRVMLRDTKGAFQDFGRAVELSPNTPHIYFNRANIYASLARYQEAEDDYTKAISLQRTDPVLYKRRAEVRGKLSKRQEAVQDYKIAIKLQTQSETMTRRHPISDKIAI